MYGDLERQIVEFLSQQRIASVATCADGQVHNAAVEYVNDGATLYFVSFPDTRKLHNIVGNPEVAIDIHASRLRPDQIRGVQYFGKARVLQEETAVEHARTLFFGRNLLDPATHWALERSVIVQVVPSRIEYVDYRERLGHKETWIPTD